MLMAHTETCQWGNQAMCGVADRDLCVRIESPTPRRDPRVQLALLKWKRTVERTRSAI
jgi:hypothetical protein